MAVITETGVRRSVLFKEKEYGFYMVGNCHVITKLQSLGIKEKKTENVWKCCEKMVREDFSERDTGSALDFLYQIWIWIEPCIIKEMGITSTCETNVTVWIGEQMLLAMVRPVIPGCDS